MENIHPEIANFVKLEREIEQRPQSGPKTAIYSFSGTVKELRNGSNKENQTNI